MTDSSPLIPEFLDKVVDFPDGASYALLHPLTDYRACDQGTPLEARIVYSCKEIDGSSEQEYIVKIKVQHPGFDGDIRNPEDGPSTTTALELKALETFQRADSVFAPKLRGFKQIVQGNHCPLPGGYITYTLMNKLSGVSLFDLHYWGMSEEEREEITHKFVKVLRYIYELGIQPEDRALRNVMWDKEKKLCSIIDFEMWIETKETFADETKELQRWGLAQTPPRMWWEIWFDSGH